MSTPESKIKDHVKAKLAVYKPRLYAHWPVQNGMGAPTLDCNGSINGRAFAIETKAPGKKLTPRQEITAHEMREAGVRVFVIDGPPGIHELHQWLEIWHVRDIVEAGL